MNKHSLSSHHRETRASCRVFNFDQRATVRKSCPQKLGKASETFFQKKRTEKIT